MFDTPTHCSENHMMSEEDFFAGENVSRSQKSRQPDKDHTLSSSVKLVSPLITNIRHKEEAIVIITGEH